MPKYLSTNRDGSIFVVIHASSLDDAENYAEAASNIGEIPPFVEIKGAKEVFIYSSEEVKPLPKHLVVDNKDVHTEHCCHTCQKCKYNDEDCSVVTGVKRQSNRCTGDCLSW